MLQVMISDTLVLSSADLQPITLNGLCKSHCKGP